MKWIIVLAAIITTLGTARISAQSTIGETGPDAPASPNAAGSLNGHSWVWKQLNLTDAQQKQIHGIMASSKPRLKGAMMNVLKAQKDLMEAIVQSPSDVGKIRQYAQAVEGAKTELTVDRAQVRAAIMTQVLSPEQQQRFMQIERQREDWLQRQIDKVRSS